MHPRPEIQVVEFVKVMCRAVEMCRAVPSSRKMLSEVIQMLYKAFLVAVYICIYAQLLSPYIYTHTDIYIYIYVCLCVC